jgi:uncharacterized membrane protein
LNVARTRAQHWADVVTEFSGSWPFIIWFIAISAFWVLLNVFHLSSFDPYPFLFLNMLMTAISTFQSPLIMLSQNRQNERDRENIQVVIAKLDEALERLARLEENSK